MSDFVPVAKVSDLSDPGKMLIEVGDRVLVLCRIAGEFYCLDDVCTHDGGPLADGDLDDHQIICPRHGARFDVRDGRATTMPATVDTHVHEVRVEGENVLVRCKDDS